jgi:hypothetical protein
MIQVSYFGSSCAVVGISGHSSIICNLVEDVDDDVDVDLLLILVISIPVLLNLLDNDDTDDTEEE